MDPLNIECDLQSLRILYGLLLRSNANNESLGQPFLLDENTQFLLKRLLDSATDDLLTRQSKVLTQAQLCLPERVSKNSVSRGIIKLPSSKAGLTEELIDSIERIETQLSAFRFCSSRVLSHDDRTRSCKSPIVNNNAAVATVRRRFDPTLTLHSQGSCSHDDDQIVLVRSRPPLPPRSLRSVGFKKPRQGNKTTQKMVSMKPTLLDETWDEDSSSEDEEQVSSTEQESEEVSEETVSTSGSSWETHAESITESDSSYPSESYDDDGDDGDDDDDENSQVSNSPPRKRRDRSSVPEKQRKKATGRLKRFKDKLGKVFHHHHHHHHHHHQHKEEEGRKVSGWKRLVKKHLRKDKEKLAERRWKTESKGMTRHNNNKGGQFHALVKGFMRHHRRHSKKKKQKLQSHGRKMKWWETPKRQGGVKFPNGGRVKLGKTNYLCNKDLERDEN